MAKHKKRNHPHDEHHEAEKANNGVTDTSGVATSETSTEAAAETASAEKAEAAEKVADATSDETSEKTAAKKTATDSAGGKEPPKDGDKSSDKDTEEKADEEKKAHSSKKGKIVLATLAGLIVVGGIGAWQGAQWMVNTRPIPFKAPVVKPNTDTAADKAAADAPKKDTDAEALMNPPEATTGGTPNFVIVTVKEGDNSMTVAEKLRTAGFDLPNWVMKVALRLHPNTLNKLHQGRYKIATAITPAGLLDTFGRGALIEGVIRIPDGAPLWEVRALFNDAKGLTHETREMTDDALAQALNIDEKSPEGFLAPDTYRYTEGVSDLAVMKLAVKRQKTLLTTVWDARGSDLQVKTPYEALILASIIEKESGVAGDRSKISSVFHNRLAKSMPLQTDPTVIYGLGPQFNGNLTKKDLQADTPYNTYKIAALPPTPIGAPSAAALKAAVNPENTPYLYFVSRGDGTSEFSTNLNAHNRAVNKFILGKPKAGSAASSSPASANGNNSSAKSDKAGKIKGDDKTSAKAANKSKTDSQSSVTSGAPQVKSADEADNKAGDKAGSTAEAAKSAQ